MKVSLYTVVGIAFLSLLFGIGLTLSFQNAAKPNPEKIVARVIPPKGLTIPVKWKDLGAQLVDAGVIDREKFQKLYESRNGWNKDVEALLTDTATGDIKISQDNAGVWLNLLWAFGLANKNTILEQGPMNDPRYGGAEGFASTGGWTLSNGDPMTHYSMHSFVELTQEQQALVAEVSQGIYRPCCGNSTYFPDCNHGMAMLGLLELLAAQGADEDTMYKTALTVNSYWFPDTYLTLAAYFDKQGKSWKKTSPKEILSDEYSSANGYRKVLSTMDPVQSGGGGGSCGA